MAGYRHNPKLIEGAYCTGVTDTLAAGYNSNPPSEWKQGLVILPAANLTVESEHPYLVLFRQGPKWVVAPKDTLGEAESLAAFLKDKWTADQVQILENTHEGS